MLLLIALILGQRRVDLGQRSVAGQSELRPDAILKLLHGARIDLNVRVQVQQASCAIDSDMRVPGRRQGEEPQIAPSLFKVDIAGCGRVELVYGRLPASQFDGGAAGTYHAPGGQGHAAAGNETSGVGRCNHIPVGGQRHDRIIARPGHWISAAGDCRHTVDRERAPWRGNIDRRARICR